MGLEERLSKRRSLKRLTEILREKKEIKSSTQTYGARTRTLTTEGAHKRLA